MKNNSKILAILFLFFFTFWVSAQSNDPEPCGTGWLCGSASAQVNIPSSYTDGLSLSPTGGISIGTEYATLMCCAASSQYNACSLAGQSNESLCLTGRTNEIFRNVKFR